MAEATKAPHGIPSNLKAYYAFKGIDRSRPIIGMDDGKGQSWYIERNGYTDWRGNIRREPALQLRQQTNGSIRHIRFFNRTGLVWAEQDGRAIHLAGERLATLDAVFPRGDVVTSCVFRGKVIFMCSGFAMRKTDGYGWFASGSQVAPGFGVAILGRMFCAGFIDEPTLVKACRVNNEDVFGDEEPSDSTSTQKASFIDIANTIGTADAITALGAFEVNRLAIFTNDQTIVYLVDPDFNNWQIDYRANIQVGCVAHNTVTKVGSDLIFCSRHGVHALVRSDANGLSVGELTLSHEVEDLYKQLLRDTESPSLLSACYDQDLGLYHIFFPRDDGQHVRLTCNLKQGYERLTWSVGDSGAARCGDFLAGTMAFGSPDGVYVRLDPITPIDAADDLSDDIIRGELELATPILWQGMVDDYKESVALIVQAAGSGTILITAFDEEGQEMMQEELQIEGRDDTEGNFPNLPLDQQYRIPFELRYRGVQLRFLSLDNGDVRLLGFAIELTKK